MNNTITITIDSLKVTCDYETAYSCGASGTFQVQTLIADTEYGELDITSIVDQGKHYNDISEVATDLKLNDVDIEEVTMYI